MFGDVPIYCQRQELETARTTEYTVPELVDFPGARYELLDGESEIAAGVHVIPTPVLYCPNQQWRYASYNEAGIIDGYLPDVPPSDAPDNAQAALMAKVEADTGLRYRVNWTFDKPQWWSTELAVSED
jgi:hypothetical protein